MPIIMFLIWQCDYLDMQWITGWKTHVLLWAVVGNTIVYGSSHKRSCLSVLAFRSYSVLINMNEYTRIHWQADENNGRTLGFTRAKYWEITAWRSYLCRTEQGTHYTCHKSIQSFHNYSTLTESKNNHSNNLGCDSLAAWTCTWLVLLISCVILLLQEREQWFSLHVSPVHFKLRSTCWGKPLFAPHGLSKCSPINGCKRVPVLVFISRPLKEGCPALPLSPGSVLRAIDGVLSLALCVQAVF